MLKSQFMLGKQERPIETVDKRLLDTIGIQLVKPFWVVTEDQCRQLTEEQHQGEGHDQGVIHGFFDILGVDWYTSDLGHIIPNLKFIMATAQAHGKVAAVTETGFEGMYDKQTDSTVDNYWTTRVLEPLKGLAREMGADFALAYVLFWANSWNKPEHYYVPDTAHPAVDDFRVMASDPFMVFLP